MGVERPASSTLRDVSVGPPGWPAGARLLVPGLAQWGWRQPERALVLFGSFASALGAGLFAWGTWGGVLLLLFAFGTHVTSSADAIRQGAFPGFGRLVPWASASAGLGLGCYAPALLLATLLAWPGVRGGPSGDGYLINRWAYGRNAPTAGEWVWIDGEDGQAPWVARVLATPGQAVSWVEDRLRVAGRTTTPAFGTGGGRLAELTFEVPEGHVLVAGEATAGGTPPGTPARELRLVARRAVVGRAWARLYPVWERGLLP